MKRSVLLSAALLAVSMGIYDKMIFALTHIFKEIKKSERKAHPNADSGIQVILIHRIFFEKDLEIEKHQ